MYDYILKRSARKTLSLKIDNDLNIVVSAPIFLGKNKIDEFVLNHTKWIEKHIKLMAKKRSVIDSLDEQRIEELKRLAKSTIPKKVEHYASLMNVNPTGIKITSAKKRFGSCSGKNSLCFSYLLMLYPDEAVDYVVVHELAHIKHHNHSTAFYKFVSKFLPDYKLREAILKGV